mgnify:CR=1 FL=1
MSIRIPIPSGEERLHSAIFVPFVLLAGVLLLGTGAALDAVHAPALGSGFLLEEIAPGIAHSAQGWSWSPAGSPPGFSETVGGWIWELTPGSAAFAFAFIGCLLLAVLFLGEAVVGTLGFFDLPLLLGSLAGSVLSCVSLVAAFVDVGVVYGLVVLALFGAEVALIIWLTYRLYGWVNEWWPIYRPMAGDLDDDEGEMIRRFIHPPAPLAAQTADAMASWQEESAGLADLEVLLCPYCGTRYRIGVDAAIVAQEELERDLAGMGIDSPKSTMPLDPVYSIEDLSGEALVVAQSKARVARDTILRALASGQIRRWVCMMCGPADRRRTHPYVLKTLVAHVPPSVGGTPPPVASGRSRARRRSLQRWRPG